MSGVLHHKNAGPNETLHIIFFFRIEKSKEILKVWKYKFLKFEFSCLFKSSKETFYGKFILLFDSIKRVDYLLLLADQRLLVLLTTLDKFYLFEVGLFTVSTNSICYLCFIVCAFTQTIDNGSVLLWTCYVYILFNLQ